MDIIQIGSILAQIDYTLSNRQHDFLHNTKILKEESKKKLVRVFKKNIDQEIHTNVFSILETFC